MIAPTTTANTDKTAAYQSALITLQTQEAWPWLKTQRADQYTRFETLGFATRQDEEWKYTSVKALQKNQFTLAQQPGHLEPALYESLLPEDAVSLVFVDGFFMPSLSRLAELEAGLSIHPLSALLKEGADLAKTAMDPWEGDQAECFSVLNTALARDGVVLKVDDNTQLTKEIHFVHAYSGDAHGTMTFPRNLLEIGSGCEVKLFQTSLSADPEAKYFSNALTHMTIGANSHVRFVQVQLDSLSAYQFQMTRVLQAQDSQFHNFVLTTGGDLVRNSLAIEQAGTGAHTGMHGLTAVRAKQHVDNHTVVNHRFEHGTSNQLYKGILRDEGRTVFNGKIYVQPAAQLTNAYQLNRNLLLSPKAQAYTRPQLEIYADDVRCTHGASVGPLDQEQLFYLLSRGIPRAQAVSLLAHGFVEDVLEAVPDNVRDRLRQHLNNYFVATEIN